MIAKKLLVAGMVGTAMLFAATSNTASAAPPRVRVVARPGYYGGAYWNRPYYYNNYNYAYSTVYVPSTPVVETVAPVCEYGPYWRNGVYVGAPRVGIRIGR
ncbi:MAG TPA: hypothetical protein VFG04_11670 [Planctomycetaceae bacterium]|nr:hypothetical protein [Planctomycetaceae bacterium]